MIFLYSRSAENIFRLQELIFRLTHTLSTRSEKLRHNLYKTYGLVLKAAKSEGDREREATAYASGFTQ